MPNFFLSFQILWLLGKQYAHLETELLLNMTGSCIGLFAGISYGLLSCRGWAINPVISIPVSFLSIVVGVSLMDISTLQGVLYLNIFVAIIQVLLNGTYCLLNIIQLVKPVSQDTVIDN